MNETIQSILSSQQQHYDTIRAQRENVVALLATQLEQLEKLESNHMNVTAALETQGKDLEGVEYLRNMMLDCSLKQKQDMSAKILEINGRRRTSYPRYHGCIYCSR